MPGDEALLAAWRALSARGEEGVLCSVVHVEGSTYRGPGARMLVRSDGSTVGLVSGGCLEGDLIEQAAAVRASGRARLVHYDSRGEQDIVWGLGLGCAGVVDVLLERVGPEAPGPLAFLARCAAARSPAVIATATGEAGDCERAPLRWRLHPDGAFEGDVPDPGDRVEAACRAALVTGSTRRIRRGEQHVLVEVVPPALRLLVLGAGPDAEPLVRIAREVGWEPWVVDWRPAFARPDRFPEAARVVHCPADALVEQVPLDAHTAAVVMTHHYLNDRALLGALLPSPVRYVGALGPRQRTDDLLADLRGDGFEPTEAALARLYAPAGLDVGAEGPEAIALAIAAEIQAVCAGRPGGWLRAREGPIHDGRA